MEMQGVIRPVHRPVIVVGDSADLKGTYNIY